MALNTRGFDPDNIGWGDAIRLIVWCLGIGVGITLLGWRWFDLFIWPLTWLRGAADVVALLTAGLILRFTAKIWPPPTATLDPASNSGEKWGNAMQWAGLAGAAASTSAGILQSAVMRNRIPELRAALVGTVLLGAGALIGAFVSDHKAATAMAIDRTRQWGIARGAVWLLVLGANSYLHLRAASPGMWAIEFFAPPTLVTGFYGFVYLRTSEAVD